MKILPRTLIIVVGVLLILLSAALLLRKRIVSFLAPPPEKVSLTYWGLFEPREVMEPLILAYQQEHPEVEINYQLQAFPSFKQYKKTLFTRLRQGGGPDIMRIHGSWIPSFQDLLSPLPSQIMTVSEFGQAFYPIFSEQCQQGGSTLCLPLMYDGLVLLYNKDLFSEAVISSPPETWEGFRKAAIKLSEWQDDDPQKALLQAGSALGAAENVAYASDILGLMLAQSEVTIPGGLATQAAQDVFTFYTNFVLKDHVWDKTWPSSVSAFSSGKVGMIFAPSWEVARLAQEGTVDFGVAPVPQVPTLEGGLTRIGWATPWVEVVSQGSEHAAEAWEFLQFLSEKDAQQTIFDAASRLRGFGFAYPRQDMQEVLSSHLYLGAVVEQAREAKGGVVSSCSGNPDYEGSFLEAIAGTLSGRSVETSLKTAQTGLETLISGRSLGLEGDERSCSLISIGPGVGEAVVEEAAVPSELSERVPEEEEAVEEEDEAEAEESTPTPPPLPECRGLSASPTSGEVPLKVLFSARASDATKVAEYQFVFGDGAREATTSASLYHTYADSGTFSASVSLKDYSSGALVTDSLCQATVSAQKVTVPESEPESEIASPGETDTGFSAPLIVVSAFSFLLLLLGFLL